MGSNTEVAFKKHIHPKIKKPVVDILKECAKLMPSSQRISFGEKYGNILKLLEVNVQTDAISALIQFYDSPMRCFTFRDFQMAPTLEEFAAILGYPLKDMKPYRRSHNENFMQETAVVLRVGKSDLEGKKQNRNGVDGFPLKYFEERMRHFAEAKEWVSFKEILALAIFGIILFPHLDDYIDFMSIDVFLATQNKGQSPVSAILADTYCTLTRCHEKKGKRLSCCLATLYVWLINHAFDHKCRVTCPIADVKVCDVKVKNGGEWAQTLADLGEKTVRWYPKWLDVQEVIYQCGNFSNVPLIGTKGCINYNPSVALRQLCYPMMLPPTDEMVTPFVVYKEDQEDAETLKRVRHAWDRIQKGEKLGKRSTDAKDAYRHWLKARVQQIRLPFQSSVPIVEDIPVQSLAECEEIEKLKTILSKSEEGKLELQEELRKARRDYEKMQMENSRKTALLERVNKRAKVERDRRLKFQNNLRASDGSLTLRRQERDQALFDKEQMEEQLKRSKVAEKEVKRQLENLKQQLENVVAEYKERVENERQQKEELASMYNDLWRTEQVMTDGLKGQVREQHERAEEFRQEMMAWMDHSTKLTWVANQAIASIPDLLEKAEEKILPFETPKEIIEFIEHCGSLFREMRNLTRRRK